MGWDLPIITLYATYPESRSRICLTVSWKCSVNSSDDSPIFRLVAPACKTTTCTETLVQGPQFQHCINWRTFIHIEQIEQDVRIHLQSQEKEARLHALAPTNTYLEVGQVLRDIHSPWKILHSCSRLASNFKLCLIQVLQQIPTLRSSNNQDRHLETRPASNTNRSEAVNREENRYDNKSSVLSTYSTKWTH